MKKVHFRGFFGKTLSVGLFVFVLLMTGCGDGAGGGGGSPSFAGGSGTASSPWQIETAEQLAEIRNNLGAYYVLNADINLASYGNFEPIGTFVPASAAPEDEENPNLKLAFTGVFDGNGHTISNVAISAPGKNGVGLFGCVAGDKGVVKNLVVENITVIGTMLVSGVIGYADSASPVENIILQGTNIIAGNTMVGGIVGGGFGDIKNCSATADIYLTGMDNAMAGVLAGGMEDGSIISCTATGSVTVGSGGVMGVGGLAACAHNAPEITDCTVDVTIDIQSENYIMIGGLLGYAGRYTPDDPTAISGCTVQANITVPASAERVGGLVGSGFYSDMYASMASMPGYEFLAAPSAFKVINSSTSGSITGSTDLIGTIAGYIYDNSTIEGSCTSTMTINGSTGNQTGGDKSSADLGTLK
jgi:hypothetical protein